MIKLKNIIERFAIRYPDKEDMKNNVEAAMKKLKRLEEEALSDENNITALLNTIYNSNNITNNINY